MERIKYLYENWVLGGHKKGNNTHNVSATVSIREHEWNKVANWMWNNKEGFNGLSFLPYDNGTYVQAPFEDCTNTKTEGVGLRLCRALSEKYGYASLSHISFQAKAKSI